MLLDRCTESCGWAAAILAAFAWGSFGVPIKSDASSRVDVDPLVMQTYKTTMCFLTSWIVLLMGEEVTFTPWGIVSAMFFVPGGTAGIFAIRNIGLAVSVGTWSSIIVMFSFFVGVFLFNEGVKSVSGATCAAILLITGIAGMSRYSKPQPVQSRKPSHISKEEEEKEKLLQDNSYDSDTSDTAKKRTAVISPSSESTIKSPLEMDTEDIKPPPEPAESTKRTKAMSIFGMQLTRRQVGLSAAVFNGVWGGSNMIPLHFAKDDGAGGLGYVISFGCGGMIVVILLWMFRYMYHVYNTGSLREAYYILPSFHFRQLWYSGFCVGTLYSIGNICSIISVTYLGQGVGYSVTQSAMLVSGLWGIFYFGEIKGNDLICKW
eukprot:CAMPEP_0195512384 /NCGR_PEP_ID=MMETSP0794_2-20130614/4360_1 /TAXON_ID=515487 /ORGANISM="Stephanopyxis turris, Strain CCMP 815" /LENGTH=375 /DNA_ID=CAMNT_0040640157 /DNA_START=68 /DNA_END=1192 /DNA_ORIENTATION=-